MEWLRKTGRFDVTPDGYINRIRQEAWQARAEADIAFLNSPQLLEALTDLCANGWEYGTHPTDKAKMIIETLKKEMGNG